MTTEKKTHAPAGAIVQDPDTKRAGFHFSPGGIQVTFEQAIAKAHRIARKTRELRFVVLEDGYQVCRDEETETFFLGAPIIYCTADHAGGGQQ